MKYSKQIVFFLLINLVIVFLSIFIANITRKLELVNNRIKIDIKKQEEQLSINKIEYTYYNNSDYLKKLHSLYFSYEEKDLEKKIVLLSNISDIKNKSVILVNLKSE
jgi:hypothetical protein